MIPIDYIPSYQAKFQCSSFGSEVLKNSVAFTAVPLSFAMVKVKLGSGSFPLASEPFIGAWTSRRMSKYCPAKKSALGYLSRGYYIGSFLTYWFGGKTQPGLRQYT